jgi:LDH2 family malate/lactate/ureidoglycolate dehydrogenase
VTFATTNTDSMVALYDGAQKFHGTNPLAFAAPVPNARPWLLDMATSSIPLNRVLLHRSLDKKLPEGVAATSDGQPTTDPHEADMLLPLGGVDYGYKGAALAGVATLFSALPGQRSIPISFRCMAATIFRRRATWGISCW